MEFDHQSDFHGGPVVKTLPSKAVVARLFQSLFGELRSQMQQDVATKKKKKRKKSPMTIDLINLCVGNDASIKYMER